MFLLIYLTKTVCSILKNLFKSKKNISLKMIRIYLVLLLLILTFASTLTTSSSSSHLLTFRPSHQAKVESPCDDDQQVVDKKIKSTPNGCGSAPWNNKLAKSLSPYIKYLTPCCDAHDLCFDTCAISNFGAAFKKCNVDFKNCMYKVCLKVEGSSWASKQLCKLNAKSFYKAVKTFGQTPYNNAQNKHCDCV